MSNPSLTSTVSEFSKGRTERSNKLRLPATIRNLITRIRLWLGKLFSLAFIRVLMIFLLGFCCQHSLAVLWRRGQKNDRRMVPAPCLAGTGARALWRFCRAIQSGVARPHIGAAKPRQALDRD